MAKAKDSVVALMEEDALRPPPPDKVEAVRQKMARVREIELERASLAEKNAALGTELFTIKNKELVELFDAAKIDKLGIPADGNMPAYEMVVGWHYKANLALSEDLPKAIAWIKKTDPDLLKTTYEVHFGLREDTKRKAFEAFLKKSKIEYTEEFGVPWNTLTAWLKQRLNEKKPKPTPLKLLGATVERVADVVKQRKSRTEPKTTATKGKN
jgi:hypothetical protein